MMIDQKGSRVGSGKEDPERGSRPSVPMLGRVVWQDLPPLYEFDAVVRG